jgi:hypothetical protein
MRPKKPYHKRKPLKKQIELLCSEAGPEDGLDPRYDRPASASFKHSRKALQLCRQVQRALGYGLAEVGDPVLAELEVMSVEPAPNSRRLLVRLRLPRGRGGADGSDDVTAHLERAAGKIRCAVAAAIHRKKTPELAYCIMHVSSATCRGIASSRR